MDIRQIIDVSGTAEVPLGSTWDSDIDNLANSDWDATWISTDAYFGHLPQRNHARQHKGFSSASSSPETQFSVLGNTATQNGRRDMPCPSVTLPRPSLEFDFRIGVTFESGGRSEAGILSGGSWTASFGAGTVIAGDHGLDPGGCICASFQLRTNDEPPAILEFSGRGTPLTKGGSWRMVINIASDDPKYAKVVRVGLWIGAGVWKDMELVIDAYRVG